MPQSERTDILKELLLWIRNLTDSDNKGINTQGIIDYTITEITELGATPQTAKKYIEILDKMLLIEYKTPRWTITNKGRDWLDRHV